MTTDGHSNHPNPVAPIEPASSRHPVVVSRRYTRREMIACSAGSLLSLGVWPGALCAEATGAAGPFHFVVVNDIHYLSERCGAWLERVIAKILAGPKPEFCLLVGDQSDHGTVAELTAVKEAFARLGVASYPVIGNHDYLTQTDCSGYETVFPGRLNYHFEHEGWRVLGLDNTEGLKGGNTTIPEATLQWLDEHLPKLDQQSPLVLFTHFPLGDKVQNRPRNADAVLERFRGHNLRGVFNGHHHAFTERHAGAVTLVTNRCCSVSRPNHDQSTEKGFFLCEAREGNIRRTFVEVDTAGLVQPETTAKAGAEKQLKGTDKKTAIESGR